MGGIIAAISSNRQANRVTMSSKPTLGYWPARALAQPIRNLLVLAGVDFEDKRYPFGAGTTFASMKQNWDEEKASLGLDFPNLPYWVDGDVKLTQSMAIMKYLARKHGLISKDNEILAKQEMLEQQLRDYLMNFCKSVAYNDNYLDVKDDYIATSLPQVLDSLEVFIGDNQWFTDEFSYVDILAYEVLDVLRMFSPSSFDSYPKLIDFLKRFEDLPEIKEYFNSPRYNKWPAFSPVAKWGYYK